MAEPVHILSAIALSFICIVAAAFDPPLQDFCVAHPNSTVRLNGLVCKNPATVTPNDFFFSGLHLPSNTSNIFGAGIIPVTVNQVPGLNTLGISVARVDLAEGGLFPPHTHPKSTEVVIVVEGLLEVGFVTSNPTYTHFNKTLGKGDVFAVPPGLVHYAYNAGKGTTTAFVAWNSQNLGVILLNKGIFGATPDIDAEYLAKSFFLDKKIVERLQAKF